MPGTKRLPWSQCEKTWSQKATGWEISDAKNEQKETGTHYRETETPTIKVSKFKKYILSVRYWGLNKS